MWYLVSETEFSCLFSTDPNGVYAEMVKKKVMMNFDQ